MVCFLISIWLGVIMSSVDVSHGTKRALSLLMVMTTILFCLFVACLVAYVQRNRSHESDEARGGDSDKQEEGPTPPDVVQVHVELNPAHLANSDNRDLV